LPDCLGARDAPLDVTFISGAFANFRLEQTAFPLHRIHSRRSRSMPAASAECGSKLSPTSTIAQISRRWVASAKAANRMLLRPDDAAPHISVSAPRGRPPVSASTGAIPKETVGATARWRRDAGTTPGMESGELMMGLNGANGEAHVSDFRGFRMPLSPGTRIRLLFASKILLAGIAVVNHRGETRARRGFQQT
jgi:hypothetical protein